MPHSPHRIAALDQLSAHLDEMVKNARAHRPDCDVPDLYLCPGAEVWDTIYTHPMACFALLAMAIVRLAEQDPKPSDVQLPDVQL